jgi:hypothetical protein
MAGKYIYVKLIKEWGGYRVGDVIRFGYSKGIGRIEKGEGVQVKKQQAVNDPIIETATVNPQSCTGIPETETAILDIRAKADAKAKAKAEAKGKLIEK